MSGFDKFMVVNDIGTGRKLRRLPVVQRWTYVAGVLAIASQSPIRGALLIHDGEHATVRDIAEQATVKDADARATLVSLRRLGMLETDAHGVDWVPDWDEINPTPKPSDSPEARRQRKREQREREQAERHADVTRDKGVTSLVSHTVPSREPARSPEGREEEVEEQLPPNPPHGGSDTALHLVGDEPPVRPSSRRKRDIEQWHTDVAAWEQRHPTLPASSEETAVWSESRKALREMVSESTYDIWLKPLRLLGTRDGVLLLEAPHHIASWVQDRFADNLAAAFAERGIYAWQLITGPSTSTNGAAA